MLPLACLAFSTLTGCGGSDQQTAEDFERIMVESEASVILGPDVAADYAQCLYREIDGKVDVLLEHLDDAAYQPEGPEAAAVAACSDVLIDAETGSDSHDGHDHD